MIPTEHLWIGSPNSQGVVQDHVRRNAANAPYLLYSALAFAAAHRHHLSPNDNKYRVAAPYHYQHSLQKYFEKLNNTLTGNEADSLLVSCQLHASLAFLNAGTVHNGGLSIDLGWVRSMRGVRFITQSPELMTSLSQGRFHEIARLASSDWTEICEREPRDRSPRAATDLRQVQALEHLTAALHPDQRAVLAHTLSMLRDLALVRPDPGVIEYFMIWINRQPSAFVELLQAAEPVALLTIGLWCALFGRIDEWWIVGPARAECHRICSYVEGLGERRFEGVVRYLRMVSQ